MPDDNDEPRAFGFAIPIPDGIREERDRRNMAAEERSRAVDRFFDGLNVEQLMILRTIFNQSDAATMNQYFDGRVYELLRRVHGVDPDTGLSPIEALERAENGRG